MKTNVDRSLTEREITTVRKSRRSFLVRVVGVGAMTSTAVLSGACEEFLTPVCDSDPRDTGIFADSFDNGDVC